MPSLGTHMHYCIELSIDTVNEHNNICKQIPVMGNVKTHIVPGFRSASYVYFNSIWKIKTIRAIEFNSYDGVRRFSKLKAIPFYVWKS